MSSNQTMSSFINSIFSNISFLPLLVPSPFATSFNRDSIPSCFHHQKSSSLSISPGYSKPNVYSLIILLSMFLQKIVRIFDPKLILKERSVFEHEFGVFKNVVFLYTALFWNSLLKNGEKNLFSSVISSSLFLYFIC